MKKNYYLLMVSAVVLLISACVSHKSKDDSFGGIFKGPVEKLERPDQKPTLVYGVPEMKHEISTERISTTSSKVEHSQTYTIPNSEIKKPLSVGIKTEVPAKYSKSKNTPSSGSKSKSEKGYSDLWFFLAGGGMVLLSFGLFKAGRKKWMKVTRWATQNPKKTQAIIFGIQIPLAGMAVMEGYNLHEMGFTISHLAGIICGSLAALGLFSVPFKMKKGLTLPSTFAKNRFKYAAITMLSLMSLASFGNRASEQYKGTAVANTLEKVDKAWVGSVMGEGLDMKSTDNHKKEMAVRQDASGVAIAMAVLLTMLLLVTLCAGICLTALGVTDGLIEYIVLGVLISLGSIVGIIAAWKAVAKSKIPQQGDVKK